MLCRNLLLLSLLPKQTRQVVTCVVLSSQDAVQLVGLAVLLRHKEERLLSKVDVLVYVDVLHVLAALFHLMLQVLCWNLIL